MSITGTYVKWPPVVIMFIVPLKLNNLIKQNANSYTFEYPKTFYTISNNSKPIKIQYSFHICTHEDVAQKPYLTKY